MTIPTFTKPLPEVVPEEQDVHADNDGYHREPVKQLGHFMDFGV
jgi:hypothetical protein